MDFRCLFVCLILLLSIGVVSAQEDVNCVDSISVSQADVLSSSEFFIDDGNYDSYFDKESGRILENSTISDGDTIKFGDVNDKDFILDRSLTLTLNSSSSLLSDVSFSFIGGSDKSSVENLVILNNGFEKSAIYVNNASDISILNCDIEFSGIAEDVCVIGADLADNFTIGVNNITFNGEMGGAAIELISSSAYIYENQISSNINGIRVKDSKVRILNNGIVVEDDCLNNSSAIFIYASSGNIYNNSFVYLGNTNGSYVNSVMSVYNSDVSVDGNVVNASLVSCPVGSVYNPDIQDYDLYIYSVAFYFDNCPGLELFDNSIDIEYCDVIGFEDAIFGVYVKDCDDVLIAGNSIFGNGYSYICGLSVIGENFNIDGNGISLLSDENYTVGIRIMEGSSGVVSNNYIHVFSPYIAYGIGVSGRYPDNMSSIEYSGNVIGGKSHIIYGISSFFSQAFIDVNNIELDGDYTTGISLYMVDGINVITDNEILVNGLKNDSVDAGDIVPAQTVGIVSLGGSQIHNNIVSSKGNYSIINYASDSEITDNLFVANMLLGDDSVLDTSKSAVVENNTPVAVQYNLTNSTFFLFFDDEGYLRNGISADLLFVGDFSNLVDEIILDRPVMLSGDNARLYNMGIEVLSDSISIGNFKFIADALSEVILIKDADHVLLYDNVFDFEGVSGDENYMIRIIDSYDVIVDDNVVDFIVETYEVLHNGVIYAEYSDSLVLSDNIINASLPSISVNWTSGEIYSKAVYLFDCDYAVLENNNITVTPDNRLSYYDTIYIVHVGDSDDVSIRYNSLISSNVPRGYGIVLNGLNFDINNNSIGIGDEGNYVCGIDIEGNSSGLISENSIVARSISAAHGIYTDNAEGDVKVNISDNVITVDAIYAFGFYLSGSESFVENNILVVMGNSTKGIVSVVDNINILYNTIFTNTRDEDIPSSYGENAGVYINEGDAIIKNNKIYSYNAEYTVNMGGTGNVTDNILIAGEYTGDASVDYDISKAYVANNTPVMYASVLTGEDLVLYYKDGTRYYVKLTDKFGNPLVNSTVVISINGVDYTKTTNDNGKVSIAINLDAGNYTVAAYYRGVNNYSNASVKNNITVLTTILANDLVKVFRNGSQYFATFFDFNGSPLKNTDVSFNINGVKYIRTTKENGTAKLNINLAQGEYVITATNPVTGESVGKNITVLPKIINNNDLVKYFRNESQYVVTLLKDDGSVAGAGEVVTFNINGVFYERKTNASGQAKLNINLNPGVYVITAEYGGCMVSNNITVLPVLTASDLVKKYGVAATFNASLVDGWGNPYPNQKIEFNINGVLYYRTTDHNGVAKLNINLQAGEYIITSRYGYAAISNKVTVTA